MLTHLTKMVDVPDKPQHGSIVDVNMEALAAKAPLCLRVASQSY